MLDELRAEVRDCAISAGLAEDRVVDVVLAAHELAANAVQHGGGAGRLRLWDQATALHCRVDDGDIAADAAPAETENGRDPVVTDPLAGKPGHGLWVVRRVSDRAQSLSGPRGTSVVITFHYGFLPGTWLSGS